MIPHALVPVLLLAIVAVSIVCMMVRPLRIAEAYWACGGALLLVVTRLIPSRRLGMQCAKGGTFIYFSPE